MVTTDFFNPKSRLPRLFCLSLSMLFFFAFSTNLLAQGPLACNNNVNVSLNEDCEAEITPGMILEGEDDDLLGNYSVSISGVTGTIVTSPGTYTVTITDDTNGNSCWGTMDVEDKIAPQIESCDCFAGDTNPDCQFLCSDEQGILNGTIAVPTPVVIENCGTLISEFTDVVTDDGCGARKITRSWLYTDESGNTATGCEQEFILAAIPGDDVLAPVSPVILPCGADASMDGIVAYFTPSVGAATANTYGYPTANGVPLSESICNLVSTKTDVIIPVCEESCSNSFKILRDWTVLDWCTAEIYTFNQIIKAVDTDPPTVEAVDITVSTNPWDCVANFFLPAPTILHDECTPFVQYSVTGPVGVVITFNPQNNLYMASGAPKGVHTFSYVASDCCDNKAVEDITVTVIDQAAPVAVAKQNIVLSLTNGQNGTGTAKMYAQSVDNGSHDGCTDVHIEIRRDDDPCGVVGNTTYNNDGHTFDSNTDIDGGQFVKFCCEDVTNAVVDVDGDGVLDAGYVKVWMRVWDDADMNGSFGTADDNFNETWAFVKVEDKLDPIIVCPLDITIDCDADVDDLSVVGEAVANTSCGAANVEYNDIITNIDGCNVGFITRRWSVVGTPTVFCDQRITKEAGNPFNGNITWPADYTTDCTDLDSDQEPTWSAPSCAQVAYSVESDTFQFEDGACFKIINQWTVLDWCQYEVNNPNTGGIWTHYQIIKVLDDVDPVMNCSNQMYAVNDHSDADNDNNQCEIIGLKLTNTATDNGQCSSEWLKWIVKVDLWGDGTYDYEFSSNLPISDNSFNNDTNGNGIPDVYLSPTNSGEEVSVMLPEDVPGSMTNHKVSWSVTDGCGNVTTCDNTFMVVDKKAPTPYCIDISTALMESGMVELWACDFDLGSFDNCTESGDLRFTFTETPPQNDPLFDDATGCSSRIFTCDDMENSPLAVQMYVWDEKGNVDYCEVLLTLVDNQGGCGGDGGRISGVATTKDDVVVPDAFIELQASILDYYRTTNTLDNGAYAFVNNTLELDYIIKASKDDDYLDGVSTLDLVMIQRHILQLSSFDNAFDVIAADINNDEKLTASDLLQLRKLILGVIDELPNVTSYRGLVKDATYADFSSPWPVQEEIVLEDLAMHSDGNDFTLVKVGDVSGDAAFGLMAPAESSTRTDEVLSLYTMNEEVESGDNVQVPFFTEEAYTLAGMQMSIDVSGLDNVTILTGSAKISDADYQVENDILLISFAPQQTQMISANYLLFTISGNAVRKGMVEDLLSLDDKSRLSNEAYNEQLSISDITMTTRAIDATEEFVVMQNEPNPFTDNTAITYYISQDDVVQFNITDANGKVLKSEQKSVSKGMNVFYVDGSELGVSGVYFYTISSGDSKSTHKMVYVK